MLFSRITQFFNQLTYKVHNLSVKIHNFLTFHQNPYKVKNHAFKRIIQNSKVVTAYTQSKYGLDCFFVFISYTTRSTISNSSSTIMTGMSSHTSHSEIQRTS